MSTFNIEVEGGKTVKLPTAGKYCDRDIIVTAKGGGGSGGDYQQGYDVGYEDGHASGYRQGYAEGEEAGYTKGYPEGEANGYTAGQTAEWKRFWDAFQDSGERTNYYAYFQQTGWNDNTFRPKYPITCVGGSSNGQSVFYNARMTKIEVDIVVINTSAKTMFQQCTSLETISKLVLRGATDCSSMFSGCSKLKNLNVDGSIDVNFSVSACPDLTDASVQSIIDHLAQLTPETTKTLTLHQDVRDKMTDVQVDKVVNQLKWTLAPAKKTGEV